jgi:hypothetical protein
MQIVRESPTRAHSAAGAAGARAKEHTRSPKSKWFLIKQGRTAAIAGTAEYAEAVNLADVVDHLGTLCEEGVVGEFDGESHWRRFGSDCDWR